MERAVLNLLTNAVKFTDDGGSHHLQPGHRGGGRPPSLRVRRTPDLGIPPGGAGGAVHAVLPFLDRARAPEIQGSGLGLAIVAAIVDSHGGEGQSATSEHLEGSTFAVRMPLIASAPTGGTR